MQHAGVPDTVRILQALQPGESHIYYIGNFTADSHRCSPYGNDPGAPKYLQLIRSIFDVAEELKRAGTVRLSRDTEYRDAKYTLPGRWDDLGILVTRYVATGI